MENSNTIFTTSELDMLFTALEHFPVNGTVEDSLKDAIDTFKDGPRFGFDRSSLFNTLSDRKEERENRRKETLEKVRTLQAKLVEVKKATADNNINHETKDSTNEA